MRSMVAAAKVPMHFAGVLEALGNTTHGMLRHDTISEVLARHFAEDEGKSPAEIQRIVGPQPVISMIATGVKISDSAALDPPVQ